MHLCIYSANIFVLFVVCNIISIEVFVLIQLCILSYFEHIITNWYNYVLDKNNTIHNWILWTHSTKSCLFFWICFELYFIRQIIYYSISHEIRGSIMHQKIKLLGLARSCNLRNQEQSRRIISLWLAWAPDCDPVSNTRNKIYYHQSQISAT